MKDIIGTNHYINMVVIALITNGFYYIKNQLVMRILTFKVFIKKLIGLFILINILPGMMIVFKLSTGAMKESYFQIWYEGLAISGCVVLLYLVATLGVKLLLDDY